MGQVKQLLLEEEQVSEKDKLMSMRMSLLRGIKECDTKKESLMDRLGRVNTLLKECK